MAYMASEISDIADMPRGGPDASCLDRLLETGRQEYLDRDDVDDEVKRGIVATLDRVGALFREHDRNAELVLREVADVADPRILELGAGHGALSRTVLEQHPTAQVTVSDVNPESVAAIAASDLGDHPRASVRVVDATAIDAADGAFDLAVFALSFHHLSPAQAVRVLAEGTRVAAELLIIDLPRWPAPLHVAKLAAMAPLALWWPFAHDGLISSLRSYSPSALRALGAHAGVDVEVSTNPFDRQVLVARRGD
ncbi:class I SAM-dependent methyltransferase [Mycobacterium sp. shizuoka-1]|uniref:class I SAM-dependent methyltransferase n=1 Tax=Mycobacterium sp. shizuoka-1 TaxID=2039281 RepID=UPI000C068232|nr:class I SAM-dependent methyltransferase [Mycobacterium sp. shizuoka-1]